MKAEYIDHLGDDLRVVNSARVSFDTESQWELTRETGTGSLDGGTTLSERDQKLIRYLAKHEHFTPFTHVMITMRETVPIFVARQRFKHMVGFTYNEVSRRYVDAAPEFYTPDHWRSRPNGSIKQGSGSGIVSEASLHIGYGEGVWYSDLLDICKRWYENAIERGVAPEQARMALPQAAYTSYYVTGSLAAWSRAYKLRSSPDAQLEIQTLAAEWEKVISGIPELKHSWGALTQ